MGWVGLDWAESQPSLESSGSRMAFRASTREKAQQIEMGLAMGYIGLSLAQICKSCVLSAL